MRFWRDASSNRRVDLVTSWRALVDLAPVEKGTAVFLFCAPALTFSPVGSGLVTDWQQQNGLLLASGDVRFIRVWDAHKELCELDMPTFSDSSISCLTSENTHGNLIIAGCGDGAVRMYDRRVAPREWYVLVCLPSGPF